jgi:Fe2+ transport system protein FeoA
MRKVAARNMTAMRKAATARKTSVKAREPERDYSHRLLIDKLGVKPGQRIAVLGVESAEFLTELAARVPEYAAGKGMAGADLIFFSAEAVANLGQLSSLGRSIQKNGAVWVVYPKGQKHIRGIDVIKAGRSAGLTDNKVCSFSATHTALRFCIPVAKR